ncbi:MAG TPA: hypothetical protein PKW99_11985, partial [Thauera sp.]|nr:hypothetical protein [Dokdonella sp.]HQZ03358.1 hypothetical protein [Thauera sp.]
TEVLHQVVGEAVVVVDHQESHDYKSLILLMFLITRTLHYSLHYTHRQSLAMDEVRAGAC